MPTAVSRAAYAALYGPSTGDRIRLADSGLFVTVEDDLTVYGEELLYGPGKVVRDGMGQSQAAKAAGAVDTVITNVVIVDHLTIRKADVGLSDGRIAAIGKAGNPDVQSGVTIIVGPGTQIIPGERKILTAGAVDIQAAFISPAQVEAALTSGVTCMLAGAVEIGRLRPLIEAADGLAMNVGFAAAGNVSLPAALREQLAAGACALDVRETRGATPMVIENSLDVADDNDVQMTLHTDTPNEAGYVEDTIRSLRGRSAHIAHVEGAGGGHAPDGLILTGELNIMPSASCAAMPYGRNLIDELLNIIIATEGLDPRSPEDVAYVESRIRKETLSAQDILLDMGVISMVTSGGQAMGRGGELWTRTWQTADKMKRQCSPGDADDNMRVKRYIAKVTINPAISQGLASQIGSVEVGKRADLVLWDPAFFGVRPDLVLLGGVVAASLGGDLGAATPASQPVRYRPGFAAIGLGAARASILFTSSLAIENDLSGTLGLQKALVAVRNTRNLSKDSMVLNRERPHLAIDPETYDVIADGERLTSEPADTVCMAQRYSLF